MRDRERMLRVTAGLAAPVVIRGPLNLDALLTWAAAGGTDSHVQRSTPSLPDVVIPLRRVEACGEWAWASTDCILPDAVTRAATGMTRRRDSIDAEAAARKFNRAAGPGRDQLKPVPLTVTPSLSWIACGDRPHVRQLIRRVTAVGGLRAHGYGRVRAWRIEAFDGMVLDCFVADGRARRPLPAVWCTGTETIIAQPIRPPYWHFSTQRPCVPTGSPAVLRPEVVAAC